MSPERIRPGSARIRPGSAAGSEPTEVSEVSEPTDVSEAAPETAAEVGALGNGAPRAAAPEAAAPEARAGEAGLEAVPGEGEGLLEPLRAAEPEQRGAKVVTSPPAALTDEEEEEAAETAAELEEALAPPPSPALRRRGRFARLYYGQTRIEFVRRKRLWFAISSVVILAGAISLATRGLNLGIDFVGGTAWTVRSGTFSVAQARDAISPLGYGGATITVLGQSSSSRTVEVQAKLPKGQGSASTQAEATTVAKALASAAHVNQEAVSVSTVGPSWGSEITNKAIVALIVFFVLIALYISIFFEWRMALAAIVAVVHDILVTVGIYSLTGFQVTPDTVVAFLTILGYSLYDTIVVFDRVRDNVKRLAPSGKLTFSDLVNLSMNQTLARSINTSLVAILPILSVLVLGAYVLGATTLEYFGLALLIGLTTGAYSSIFIASPLVALMKEREPRYRNIRARLAQRGTDRLLLSPADIAAGLLGQDVAPAERPAPRAVPRRPAPSRQGSRTPARPPSPARRKGGRR